MATREDHRAFQATEHAVSGLSLARSGNGLILASWTEQTEDGDVLRWTEPANDDALLHEAMLGVPEVGWDVTPLLATSTGFVRMALDFSRFGELRVDDEGDLESYQPVTSLAGIAPPFRAVGLSTDAVVLAMGFGVGLQIWVRVDVDWRIARTVGGLACVSNRTFLPVPFGAATLPGDDIAVVTLETDEERYCGPRLRVFGPDRERDDIFDIAGQIVDPETGDASWTVASVVPVPTGALGVLWLSVDGRARVNAIESPASFDFDEPAYDTGEEPVRDARLMATDDQLILTFRRDDGDDVSHTQAVLIHPDGTSDGSTFPWPVDDGQCSDLSSVPRAKGVDYVCVSPCEGAGCRERWLYRGRVVLP